MCVGWQIEKARLDIYIKSVVYVSVVALERYLATPNLVMLCCEMDTSWYGWCSKRGAMEVLVLCPKNAPINLMWFLFGDRGFYQCWSFILQWLRL